MSVKIIELYLNLAILSIVEYLHEKWNPGFFLFFLFVAIFIPQRKNITAESKSTELIRNIV